MTVSEHGAEQAQVTTHVLAQGFSLVYIGMSVLALCAMLLTILKLRRDALTVKAPATE
ncbi:hypothetical protein ACT691_08880 [Vibrio metschnikovii]